MEKITISVECCLCGEEFVREIEFPNGWEAGYNEIDYDDAFCPKHSIIAKFKNDQCPGCVDGWQDCPLWSSFAGGKKTITEEDFNEIRKGICPMRVNGTFICHCGTKEIKRTDISKKSSSEAGEAFVTAIKEYCEIYG